jgi:hypothetical protein
MEKRDSKISCSKIIKSLVLVPAALFILCAINCRYLESAPISNTNVKKNMEPSNDLAKLAEKITLPATPEKVIWEIVPRGEESVIPGPTDFELRAILTFSKEDADKITDKAAEKDKPIGIAPIPLYKFIPEDLKAKMQKNGDKFDFEGDLLDASAFYKSSFKDGYLIRIKNTNQFFAHLFTM